MARTIILSVRTSFSPDIGINHRLSPPHRLTVNLNTSTHAMPLPPSPASLSPTALKLHQQPRRDRMLLAPPGNPAIIIQEHPGARIEVAGHPHPHQRRAPPVIGPGRGEGDIGERGVQTLCRVQELDLIAEP